MNVIGYLCCALGFLSLISTIDAMNLQNNKNDQQFYESLLEEDSTKPKRPFCNAFTGCGRKRSFYTDNSIGNPEQVTEKIRIPVTIYRALLRAANREIRHTSVQESIIDNEPAIGYSSFDRKIPNSQTRYQS